MANRFCRHTRRQLSELMDGQPIPWWSALYSRFHLSLCPQCKRVHRSLLGTRDALRSLRDTDSDTGPASGSRSR
jgi:hypothetical protein